MLFKTMTKLSEIINYVLNIEYKKNKGKQKLSIIKFKLNILYMYTN